MYLKKMNITKLRIVWFVFIRILKIVKYTIYYYSHIV